MAANDTQSPFLEARSFLAEAVEEVHEQGDISTARPPFLSVYEIEGLLESGDREAEAYATFLNELYDEELDEALFGLMSEASELYENHFIAETGTAYSVDAERFLQQHFSPIMVETQTMFEAMTQKWGERELNTFTEGEIDAFLDSYSATQPLAPNFEQFWGKLKKVVGKVAKGAVGLAKKGIQAAAQLGLGPILNKLLKLINPLLKKVLQAAISRLPAKLQPIAGQLAQRLPFLKEHEGGIESEVNNFAAPDVSQMQHEFNRQVANVLFAPGPIEQELEVARAITDSEAPVGDALRNLDLARERFVQGLQELKEGEDPTPQVEQFIPAILPVLKLGLKLGGRKRVVDFLAKFVAKLIGKFVGPQHTPALSQAIVDTGLRLMSLEVSTEDEARLAGSAIATTIEETVQRVAALPEYVLDDAELLEGFALEAFERAATANLPSVLSPSTYEQRPDLIEAKTLNGTWLAMPLRGAKRYKKYSRSRRLKISPQQSRAVESFGGTTLFELLQDQFGMPPGVDTEVEVALYESMPGTTIADIARHERRVPGSGSSDEISVSQFHPLTPQAAGMLLNEPGLGREVAAKSLSDPRSLQLGQRLYKLAIIGGRPLLSPRPAGGSGVRRSNRLGLTLDFPGNEIRLSFFISERKAQEFSVKLRQHTHIGSLLTAMAAALSSRLPPLLNGSRPGHVKIVHEAVSPEQGRGGALARLPAYVSIALTEKLKEWLLKALAAFFKDQSSQFIAAAEDGNDGVTIRFTVQSPPGFGALRQALKGKVPTAFDMSALTGSPTVKVDVVPGYKHG